MYIVYVCIMYVLCICVYMHYILHMLYIYVGDDLSHRIINSKKISISTLITATWFCIAIFKMSFA